MRGEATISDAKRNELVLEHLPLVKAIALRVRENLPVHVDLDDLVQAGVLGLFDAAVKYDPGKNVVFNSYAKYRIRGAILDSLRRLDWASRNLRRRHKQLEEVRWQLSAVLKRDPTEAELAEKFGIELERWPQYISGMSAGAVSSAAPPDPDLSSLTELPAHSESHPDRVCARRELRAFLKSAMRTLPERYRRVVALYYGDERTMKEIGGILGINESRVSQIHKSALDRMAAALESAGIHSSAAFQ